MSEDLMSKTVKQLKEYAAENNIDLKNAKTKTKILAILTGNDADISWDEEDRVVIKSKEKSGIKPESSVKSNLDNVISSKPADKLKPVKKTTEIKEEKVEQIALHSIKNMHWQGVGSLKRGYNVVNKEAAVMWLTRRGVREASPQEVATYYGK